MAHGTFRNKISDLMNKGKIEWVCNSPQGFYILKEPGQNDNTTTNDDHTGVNHHNHVARDKIMNRSSGLVDKIMFDVGSGQSKNPRFITNNPLYRYIKSIPFGQRSMHDIRLRFEASGIWNKVYTSLSSGVHDDYDIKESNLQMLKIDKRSNDISFSPIIIDNLHINVRIHKTDRVSVIIACSYTPVILDLEGIQRLSNALSLIQGGLTRLVSVIDDNIVDIVARKKLNCLDLKERSELRAEGGTTSTIESTTSITSPIPKFMDWIVNMWHFGVDAVHEYSGEKFNCRWELAQNIVASIYSKDWKTLEKENNNKQKNRRSGRESSVKSRIRIEKQEYPKVSLGEALRDKCPDAMEAYEK